MPAEEEGKDTSGREITIMKKGEWVRISMACGRNSKQLMLLRIK